MYYFSVFLFLLFPNILAYFLHKNTLLRDKIKLEALIIIVTIFLVGGTFVFIKIKEIF